MKRYEVLPHTADIRVRVFASTKAGLAIAALQGMFAAAGPRLENDEAPTTERPFKVSSTDFASLLVDILNEAVSAAAINKESYEDVRFNLITDTKAEGAFIGRPARSFRTEIKAATHHELDVKKNEKGEWETTIVFDA